MRNTEVTTHTANKAQTGVEERDAYEEDVSRHNMRRGVLHGAFFNMGKAFADPYAVIPLFVAGFTASRALIGLVVSLVEAMSVLPQMTMARREVQGLGRSRR